MRMWNVQTNLLCRNHLLGEHRELHMMTGSIIHKHNLKGYIEFGLIQPNLIYKRHTQLVKEMRKRGYNHKTPLKKAKTIKAGYIDEEWNKKVLRLRCKECKRLQLQNAN